MLATRWPDNETVTDQSQGVQQAKLQALVRYWGTGYDWRKAEPKLNALPQFVTAIDGLDIQFVHVRSRHPNALPLIMTHGWPGSVLELLKVIGPLTDPTAHGGRAEDAFHLAYFNGYAMWTYYNLPFVLMEPGYEVIEIPPITQDSLTLEGLRVLFPRHIHTHSAEQNLYFDADGLLRRQDYQVDVAGKARAAHLISEYVDVQGLKLATKRRVFMRSQDGTLQLDQMTVSIDLSDFRLS